MPACLQNLPCPCNPGCMLQHATTAAAAYCCVWCWGGVRGNGRAQSELAVPYALGAVPPADMRKLVCPAHAVLAGVKAVPGGNFYPGQASRAVSVRR